MELGQGVFCRLSCTVLLFTALLCLLGAVALRQGVFFRPFSGQKLPERYRRQQQGPRQSAEGDPRGPLPRGGGLLLLLGDPFGGLPGRSALPGAA